MGKFIFDYENGSFVNTLSDNIAINSDGDILMRMSDNLAMDMDSEDLHIVSDWNSDEEIIQNLFDDNSSTNGDLWDD